MTDSLVLNAREIRKDFNRRTIFDHISFELTIHDSISITGRNGSGKSTLVKILSGLLSPTAGSVTLSAGSTSIHPERRREYLGFVAPYLQLYDEFSGYENLLLATRIRGRECSVSKMEGLIERVGLRPFRDERLGTYSSGMKQRLKYAFALLHKPTLLILDEPMSNLDEAGVQMVRIMIEDQKRDGIVIIATNDAEEARMCQHNLDLNLVRLSEVPVSP